MTKRLALSLVAAALLIGAGPAGAQVIVRDAQVDVDLRSDDGSADVSVVYVLSDESAVADLTVELLGIDGATTEDVVVDGGGRIVLWPASGSRRSATLALPLTSTAGDRTVTFEYTVTSAVSEEGGALLVHVPIVSLDLAPGPEAGEVFTAELEVPDGWSIAGGFPTGVAERGPGLYGVDLPVVPAFVSLRGRTDDGRSLDLARTLELLTLLILGGFTFVGWRHLRSVAA